MLKRKWYWALAAFMILCLGSFVLLRPKPQLEPLKIYKAVAPAPKPSPTETDTEGTEITTQHEHDHGHSHDHNHNTDLHTYTADTPTNEDGYDWRNDNAFDSAVSKSDPWRQTEPERVSIDDADDTYPPRDWYKTEDPVLYIEYFQAQLIKQFGDIPEVHIVAETELKKRLKTPLTQDEHIAFLEAHYHLWPNEKTRNILSKIKTTNQPYQILHKESEK